MTITKGNGNKTVLCLYEKTTLTLIMIETILKRLAKLWIVLFIGFLAFVYVDDASSERQVNSRAFADINLLLPYSVQEAFNSYFESGCTTRSGFPFKRNVVGHWEYDMSNPFIGLMGTKVKPIGCKSGNPEAVLVIFLILILVFIGLYYVLPWLISKPSKKRNKKSY